MDREELELALIIDRREQIIAGYEARRAKIGTADETDPEDLLALLALHGEVIRWTEALDRRFRRML